MSTKQQRINTLLKLYTDTFATAKKTAKVLDKFLLPLIDAVDRRNYTEAHRIVESYRALTNSRKGMGTNRVLSPQFKAMVVEAFNTAARGQRSAVLAYYNVSHAQVTTWQRDSHIHMGMPMVSLTKQHKQHVIEPPWLKNILPKIEVEDIREDIPEELEDEEFCEPTDMGEVQPSPPTITMSEADLLMFDEED